MRTRRARLTLAAAMTVLLVMGIAAVATSTRGGRTTLTAYFDNSNGIFRGDDVMLLGVPVGQVIDIQPEPSRARITFWVDRKYKIPADVKAVIMLPQLISARAIALTPLYTTGPTLSSGSVIPEERTAVPVEWDDLRAQLQKLSDALQPTEPGGISPLGALVNTAADNLRGKGASIRDAIVKLSQALSTLGDHSGDIFATLRNLSILVSALHDSADVMRALNGNLATVTSLLANGPDEVGQVVEDLDSASVKVRDFVAENRDALGTTTDKLGGISTALTESLDDIKQTLHSAPTAFSNFLNIYQPAQASFTGALALNNFSNPVSFLCGAIQAASKLGAEQSAKLCVQYLAPILKNRQYNYLPLGENLVVGTQARPNEVTYSEDWMRPDYNPAAAQPPAAPPPSGPLPAEAPGLIGTDPVGPPPDPAAPAPGGVAIDPAAGLPGMMIPTKAAS